MAAVYSKKLKQFQIYFVYFMKYFQSFNVSCTVINMYLYKKREIEGHQHEASNRGGEQHINDVVTRWNMTQVNLGKSGGGKKSEGKNCVSS